MTVGECDVNAVDNISNMNDACEVGGAQGGNHTIITSIDISPMANSNHDLSKQCKTDSTHHTMVTNHNMTQIITESVDSIHTSSITTDITNLFSIPNIKCTSYTYNDHPSRNNNMEDDQDEDF